MARVVVNEESTAYLMVTFKDKDGNAEAPASATYRIDDVDSDTEILGDTAISPIASSVELKITPTQNRILDSTKDFEQRRVTVQASYGSTDGVNDEHLYTVKNLAKVS